MGRERINFEGIDILDILDELDIDYAEEGKNVSEEWVGVNCPFCDDPSNHLGINKDSLAISCFKCNETGTILKYLSEELGTYQKAFDIVNKFSKRELVYKEKYAINENIKKVILPKGITKIIPSKHRKYLEDVRKFDADELAEKYNLFFADSKIVGWKNRIIIPIYIGRQIVSFSSISIKKNIKIRYKHEKKERSIIPVKNLLYNSNSIRNHKKIILVEGIFDAWRIGDSACPLWGTQFTEEQISLIIDYKKVILAMDGDKDGKRSAKKISKLICPFTEVKTVHLPKKKDPDKCSKKVINFIRRLQ